MFFIVDRDLNVESTSCRAPGELVSEPRLSDRVREAAERLPCGNQITTGSLVAVLDEDRRIVRMVPTGGKVARFVIFVESYEEREVLGAATLRYLFTARENDALHQMLRGNSTDQMTAELDFAYDGIAARTKYQVPNGRFPAQ